MVSSRSWPPGLCLVLLTLGFLLTTVPGARAELRKSWQAKNVDVHTQLLKAARLEDPPSAKPPEAKEATVEVDGTSQPAAANDAGQTSGTPQRPAQFSSRVRSKYGVVKPVKPIEQETPSPEGGERAEPLHLEEPTLDLDEIQVDDATVQDDDDDDDDEGDDDDDDGDTLLGWGSQGAKHGKEIDLIENILEGVAEVQREKPSKVEPKDGPVSEDRVDATVGDAPGRLKEYTFPPVLNMTIDEPNSIVRVKLNQDVVRDMLTTGREGGGVGGKKMLRYILPLFILPFLIQSAVIPFMLTAVKLFLLKSLMAGKVAIFLLLLGAFKNFTKKESRDVYVKDVPDRRYEPSSEGFAYLAEGRPSNWVN